MKIIVCVKQVPETDSVITVDTRTKWISKQDIKYMLNLYDEHAIEEAIRIKEKFGDCEITAVTLGPPEAEKALRTCLAMGADRGILISDERLDGPDASTTALVLSRLISKIGFDLILCGKRSLDSDTSQMGPSLAEYLNIPNISGVTKIQFDSTNKTIITHRQTEGFVEVVECELPALATAERGLNEPRFTTIPSLLKARKVKIERVDLDSVGVKEDEVGGRGSGVKILNYFLPKPRRTREAVDRSSLSAADRLKMAMSGGVQEKREEQRPAHEDPHASADRILKFLLEKKLVQND